MYLPKLLKKTDISIDFIHPSINVAINNDDFSLFLKLADAIPIFKKGFKNSKGNHRPISILENVSEIYERVMLEQI